MEVYSIDEAFLALAGDQHTTAHHIKTTVQQWTGIPISIGIAPTKTLAKVANHIAKQSTGVYELTHPETVLGELPVEQIWGIGKRLGQHNDRLYHHQPLSARGPAIRQLHDHTAAAAHP